MAIKFAWHVHHGILVEPLTEPLSVRRQYIHENKPANEIQLRLRLLRRVRGRLPDKFVEAGKAYVEAEKASDEAEKASDEDRKAYVEARKAWDAACKARDAAWKAYQQTVQDNAAAITALHTTECPDCPWDGTTIFPSRRE